MISSFSHDAHKCLVRVIQPARPHWIFARDACGRVVAEIDFDGQRTAYEHDRAGRLVAKVEAGGTRTDYATDAAGRVLRETVASPGAATRWSPSTPTIRLAGTGASNGVNMTVIYGSAGRGVITAFPTW